MRHDESHHVVSLQQDAMDSLELTLSDSNGTDVDNDVEVSWNDLESKTIKPEGGSWLVGRA